MDYQLEIKKGNFNLYSPKIKRNVLEDVPFHDLKNALATEMEYAVKLDIVELLMTFPHGFKGKDGTVFIREDAAAEFKTWREEIHQRIGFLDEYYSLIDRKIADLVAD